MNSLGASDVYKNFAVVQVSRLIKCNWALAAPPIRARFKSKLMISMNQDNEENFSFYLEICAFLAIKTDNRLKGLEVHISSTHARFFEYLDFFVFEKSKNKLVTPKFFSSL